MTLDLPSRPRRNRATAALRDAVRETSLRADQLVYPMFLHDEPEDTPLASLPGQTRRGVEGLVGEVGRCLGLGVTKFILFPRVADPLKSPAGEEACNPDGLIPRAVRAIKRAHPAALVMTDVALDPYSSDGHDGIVRGGVIVNDDTVAALCGQAICHARAGADLVAPSDMMDGRVGAIRAALDTAPGGGFTHVGILAYTAKYASAFYGPFRGALDSAPRKSAPGGRAVPGDKATYQMDPANVREALRELRLDEAEGADLVMVKPAGPYLDVVRAVREATTLPVAAYQVSGEYLMLKAAAGSGWLDERAAVMEALLGIRRAGADVLLTYFAPEVALWLRN